MQPPVPSNPVLDRLSRLENRHLAVRGFLERVQLLTVQADVAQGTDLPGQLEVAEPEHLAAEGAALAGIDGPVHQLCTTTAGDDKGRGMAGELQVLQVVVVPGDVEIYPGGAQQGIPPRN